MSALHPPPPLSPLSHALPSPPTLLFLRSTCLLPPPVQLAISPASAPAAASALPAIISLSPLHSTPVLTSPGSLPGSLLLHSPSATSLSHLPPPASASTPLPLSPGPLPPAIHAPLPPISASCRSSPTP